MSTTLRLGHATGRKASLGAIALLCVTPAAIAANSITYDFNTPSTGHAMPQESRGTLVLTEIAGGVQATMTPNFAIGSWAQQIEFAWSGDAFTWQNVPTPPAAGEPYVASVTTLLKGAIDSGYSHGPMVNVTWSNPPKFDHGTSTWVMLGQDITLADFTLTATSPSKPSPAFGVFSMPSGTPSNWVAMAPVPEPGTYAMMLAGLAVIGFVAHRRNR